jgi:hypothetical protein
MAHSTSGTIPIASQKPLLRRNQVSARTKQEKHEKQIQLAKAISTARNGYMNEVDNIAEKFGR